MKLRIFILSICYFATITVFSQTPKTLLWRISGKGLQQPSYLFGTMHMSDKKLFQLGDSLYAAIESTKGFAIEVNPDELAAYTVNSLFNEEKGKTLKQVLSKEAYAKYAPMLSKKLGIPAEDITVKDVVKEKNKWINEYMEKGEMPTFLDAYLYNIAKRQGKWVGGIEDIADQAGLLDELVDETDIVMLVNDEYTPADIRKGLDEMQKVYIAEDLDEIERISNSFEHRDAILFTRNIKMARRMDSLSALRTMFFAVGAAHLPGESGVISLLRKNGFTVEPVFSSKKIDAAKYKFTEVDLPWVIVQDTSSFYSVMMPSQPTDVNVMGVVDMKFLVDISTASGFCTMAFANPATGMSDEELIESFAKSMMPKKKLGNAKSFMRNGSKVLEYTQTADGEKMRMQLLVKNNILYMAIMTAPKKEVITSADANKFFNSFTPFQPRAKTNSFAFSEQNKSVTFNTPVRMSYSKSLSVEDDGTGWQASTYMGTDLKTGMYYLFVERKVRKGFYLNDFSKILDDFKELLPSQVTDIITEGERPFKNGSGYFVKGHSTTNKEIITTMLYTFRDNRIYLFSAIGGSDDDHAFNEFFNSIELLPYKQGEWKTHKADNMKFSTWSPAPFEMSYSDDSTSNQLASFDEHSSTTLNIFTDTLSSYYWAASEEAFWKSRTDAYNMSPDSVISVTDITNGDARGKEIWVLLPGNSMSRVRMLRDSNVVYYLTSYAQKDHLLSLNIDKFFKEFRFTGPVKNYDVTTSRAEQLLSDLSDTSKAYEAYYALINAKFQQQHLPLLEKALFQNFKPVYEYGSATLINNAIATHLAELKNKSTLDLALKQYASGGKDADEMKWVVLFLLSEWKTAESYQHIQQLLTQQPRPSGEDHEFFNSMSKDLQLLKPVYPQLIKIIPDTTFSLWLTSIGETLLDSNVLSKDFFIQNEKGFHQLTDLYIKRLSDKTGEYYEYQLYNLISVLEKIGTPSSIVSLKKFLPLQINYLKKEAALALVKLQQPVDPAIFNTLAAVPMLRSGLYYQLKEMNRLDLFPKAYATQKAMAESEAYIVASDDEEPLAVSFVTEKTAEFKGKKYKFYLFRVAFESENGRYEHLLVIGGFDLSSKNIELAEYLSGFYWEKEFDPKEVNTLFKEWQKQNLEEETKEITEED